MNSFLPVATLAPSSRLGLALGWCSQLALNSRSVSTMPFISSFDDLTRKTYGA